MWTVSYLCGSQKTDLGQWSSLEWRQNMQEGGTMRPVEQ